MRALSSEELGALEAARVLKGAPPARSWPCDDPRRRCAREVTDAPAGRPTPFVAVCGGSCDESAERCGGIDLTADALAMVRIDRRAIAKVLRDLYRVDGPSLTDEGPTTPDAARLGEERSSSRTREVYVAMTATRSLLAAFLEARERAAREALVLVPTSRSVAPEWSRRYAPGARVEIEILEDAIVVRDGALRRVGKPKLVAAPAPSIARGDGPPGPVRPGGIAAQLGARQFADVAMRVIDGHTLRISAQGRWTHATFIDLGLATRARNPRAEWAILLDVCAGRGTFRWSEHGEFGKVKVYVSRLQKCLREAFGLDDDPFHGGQASRGWRAKFFASSDLDAEE